MIVFNFLRNSKLISLCLALFLGFSAGCVVPFHAQPATPGISPVDRTVIAVVGEIRTSTAAALQGSGLQASSTALPPANTPLPTHTIQPTHTEDATPVPMDTETPEPAMRAGASVVAIYLDHPPVLDGVWGEWTSKTYTANSVVYGASNYSGLADLGASYRIGWDDQYLYLAVKVGDDTYVQNDGDVYIYRGDSLEILMDTEVQADFEDGQLNSDDFQLGISPGNPEPGENPQAYLWFPKLIAGNLSKVKIDAVGEPKLYRLETAIPWSTFGIQPKAGMHLGFVLRVNDNDDPEGNARQSTIASVRDHSQADPTTWGDLVLQK